MDLTKIEIKMSEKKEMMQGNETNFLLTQEGCGVCKMAKEILKKPIEEGKLVLVDVAKPEGFALAEKHEVKTIPTVINKNNKTGFEQKCYLSKDGSLLYCDDGTEKKVL